jgi:hypothetical protein
MSDFKEMIDPTAMKIAVKRMEEKGKMTRVQVLLDIWVPTSQISEQDKTITLPMWVIQKALK